MSSLIIHSYLELSAYIFPFAFSFSPDRASHVCSIQRPTWNSRLKEYLYCWKRYTNDIHLRAVSQIGLYSTLFSSLQSWSPLAFIFSVDPCDLHVSFVLSPVSLLHPSFSPSYGISNSFVLYISISCSSYSFIFVFISSFLRSLILFFSPIFPALIPLVSSHYSILPLSSSPLSPWVLCILVPAYLLCPFSCPVLKFLL